MGRIGVYLNGEAIQPIPGSSFEWGLAVGVAPVVRSLELTRKRAERIWEASESQTKGASTTGGPLTLRIQPSSGPARIFTNLYCMELLPGSRASRARITLADSRVWWRAPFVGKSYNVRRTTGDVRLVGGALVPVQNRVVEPDYGYRRTTLNPETGKAWTPAEILADVLTLVSGPGTFEIDPSKIKLENLDDGLVLFDDGDEALARVLSALPGVELYQDTDGKIRLANSYDQSEIPLVEPLLRRKILGDARLSRRARSRFKKFTALYRRRVEVRFDFADLGGENTAGAPSTIPPGEEPRFFENVIPCPVFELPLYAGSVSIGKSAGLGEFVPFPIFLDSLEALRVAEGLPSVPKLTQQLIREVWLGRWSQVPYAYGLTADGVVNQKVASCVAAIRSHWRQTFRILSQWIDKIVRLEARRVAVLSPETGGRAKAPVFANYVEKLSQLGLSYKNSRRLSIEHQDWAEDLTGPSAAAAAGAAIGAAVQGGQCSPFDVTILDQDQGVFSIVPRLDQTGLASEYVVGELAGDRISASVAEVGAFWHQAVLAGAFRLAVILTGAQDAPNDNSKFHREEVKVEDAAKLLGVTVSGAQGQDVERGIRVEDARFPWVDAHKEATEACFFKGQPLPSSRLVNPSAIRSTALAAAARELLPFLDRMEGSFAVGGAPDIHPTGNLSQVMHRIAIDGNGLGSIATAIELPPQKKIPSEFAFLPEPDRRYLLGQVVQ